MNPNVTGTASKDRYQFAGQALVILTLAAGCYLVFELARQYHLISNLAESLLTLASCGLLLSLLVGIAWRRQLPRAVPITLSVAVLFLLLELSLNVTTNLSALDATPLIGHDSQARRTLERIVYVGWTCALFLLFYELIKSLERSQAELEQRVLDRTAALATANRRLEEEATERQQAEEGLRRLRCAMDNAAEGMITFGPDGQILDVNPILCQRLEYSRQQLLQMQISDIDSRLPDNGHAEPWNALRQDGHRVFESWYRTAAGNLLPVEVYMSHFPFGKTEYWCAFVRDISERLRIRALLEQANDQLEARVRRRTHQLQQRQAFVELILQLSTRFITLLPEQIDQAIDQGLQQLAEFAGVDCGYIYRFSADRQTMCNSHQWCSPSATSRRAPRQNIPLDRFAWSTSRLLQGETVYIADVTQLPAEAAAERAEREREGIQSTILVPLKLATRVIGFLGFDAVLHPKTWSSQDICLLQITAHIFTSALERKQADQQLRQTQFAVDRAADAIFWVLPDRRIVYANDAACRALGYTREELLNMTTGDINPTCQQHFWEQLSHDIKQRGVNTIESILRRKDGQTLPVEVSVSLFCFGDQEFVCAFVRDITERRRAQEEARRHLAQLAHAGRLNMLGQMVAGLAHELNQPLAAIANFGEATKRLLARNAPDRAGEYLGRISDEAIRAGEIIRRLRGFVRKSEPQQTCCDLNELVRDVVELYQTQVVNCIIELDLAEPMRRVGVDRIQIQQVILNLLNNAGESLAESSQPQPVIRVVTRQTADSILIRVADNGQGLPPDCPPETVFDAFFTTKDDGMGMGLAISRSIVETHQGRLLVMPNEFGGATFEVTLPIKPADQDSPAPAS